MDTWLGRHRPGRTAKAIFRLPLLLHRVGLGGLLGRRFIVVCHRGRRTGTEHRTVLEVVDYRAETGEAIVITPWPEHSDWYRNITARPAQEVWLGRRRFKPVQRMLDTAEVAAALDAYARRHAAGAIGLRRLLDWSPTMPPDRRAAVASYVRGVGFRPAEP